ncbi:MAG TPA: hypothetical protein VF576_12515 [Rubricoccaceae bacterium]
MPALPLAVRRSLSLVVATALLPACTLFSGLSEPAVTGAYSGTLATADFTLALTLTATEDGAGRVRGTAELLRGDMLIAYDVEGTRTGPALTLSLDTAADDLVLRAAVAEGGRRIAGTATGGDLRDAAVVLTR